MLNAEQKILKKILKKTADGIDPFLQIAVISSDERIAKIPEIDCKHIVVYREAEALQIFYNKNRCSARIAFTEVQKQRPLPACRLLQPDG